ncbi:MAG: hypothetical protein KY469_22940 [Actinobacteria bacterium]|nr:hypothetical protein [Actinomycetota bacterium]
MTGREGPTIRIGTRGSELARWQAEHVAARLRSLPGRPTVELELIQTEGDRIQDVALSRLPGKAFFTKELEQAILDGRVDLAVHSMKDVETATPDGLEIGAVLEREDPRQKESGGRGQQGLEGVGPRPDPRHVEPGDHEPGAQGHQQRAGHRVACRQEGQRGRRDGDDPQRPAHQHCGPARRQGGQQRREEEVGQRGDGKGQGRRRRTEKSPEASALP